MLTVLQAMKCRSPVELVATCAAKRCRCNLAMLRTSSGCSVALFDRIGGGLAHGRVLIACAATTADSANELSSFYERKSSRRGNQLRIQRSHVSVSGLKLIVEHPR